MLRNAYAILPPRSMPPRRIPPRHELQISPQFFASRSSRSLRFLAVQEATTAPGTAPDTGGCPRCDEQPLAPSGPSKRSMPLAARSIGLSASMRLQADAFAGLIALRESRVAAG